MSKSGTTNSQTHSRTREPGARQQASLDAAEALFAERGFAGVSMRDIANRSGVSQPLIQHHFHGKEGLYSAVKERAVKRFAARVDEALSKANALNSPESLFLAFGALFQCYRDNPRFMRLCAWARLEEEDQAPWPGETDLVRRIETMIHTAQEANLIRKDIDSPMITIMIAGLTHFWWDYRASYAQLFEIDIELEAFDQQYMKSVLELLVQGLSPANQLDASAFTALLNLSFSNEKAT